MKWARATAGVEEASEEDMQMGTDIEGGSDRRVAATGTCQSAVESPHIVGVVGPTCRAGGSSHKKTIFRNKNFKKLKIRKGN